MAEQDSHVQVAADGEGKLIDNAALLREGNVAGEEVYRQRVVLSSDENPRLQARLGGEAGEGYLMMDSRSFGEMLEVLTEIRDMLKLTIGH